MRILPVSLLYAIFAPVVLGGSEQLLDTSGKPVETSNGEDEVKPTIFNGVEVPVLPEINGDKFDATIREGYWFVKHYSPYCIHCQHIAPIWQTLYEYYLTSKPVPAGAAVDAASTSMNSFTAYYDFHFGSLDCVAFGTACSNHNVGTFPQFLLYKDGKVVKRFEGDRNMKGLSDFIEESLETIRPGSRPINGPKLPEAEAKRSPDYEGPDAKEDDSKKQAKLTPEFLDEDESKSRSKKGSKAKESDTAKGYNTKAKSSKSKSKDSDTAKGYHSKGKDSEATLKDGDSTKDYGSKGKKLDAKVKDPTKEESEAILDKAEKKEAAEKKAQIEEIAALKVAEDEAVAAHNKATYGPTKSSVTVNSGGNVISFDAETFMASVTMSKELWFVKFYAPWCHHCQAMAPNWQQLGKDMKGRLNIGEVDCEANGRLCKDVNVQSYPTLLLFKGGQRVEYQGLRGLGDFVSYAEKAIEIGSGVKDVTATELREMEEMEDVIFIYFYDHATTIEDFKALDKLTLNLVNHAKIVKTDSAILADRYKITTWPRLVVSRSGRPTYFTPLAPYEMRDYGNVLHWMQTVWQPLVPELTAYNAREIMDGKIVVLGLLSRERPDEFMMAKNEIKTAALEWMDKQTQQFQLERQELRDAKQLRIEEAEDRNDQRALRNAKTIRINMDRSDRKEVVFAWVDGVFWERWIRTTYGIAVKNEGEKVVINDEDNRQYWDQTITGNFITPSRTAILDTIPKVLKGELKPKSTISMISKFFFNIRKAISDHPIITIIVVVVTVGIAALVGRRRRNRSGFFRLDEKMDGLLGVGMGGRNGGGGSGKND